jgi:hypothetical protein
MLYMPSFCPSAPSRRIVGRRKRVGVRVDLSTNVDGDDVGAFLGHRKRVRTSLTTRSTSDESDFSLEPTWHRDLLTLAEPHLRPNICSKLVR